MMELFVALFVASVLGAVLASVIIYGVAGLVIVRLLRSRIPQARPWEMRPVSDISHASSSDSAESSAGEAQTAGAGPVGAGSGSTPREGSCTSTSSEPTSSTDTGLAGRGGNAAEKSPTLTSGRAPTYARSAKGTKRGGAVRRHTRGNTRGNPNRKPYRPASLEPAGGGESLAAERPQNAASNGEATSKSGTESHTTLGFPRESTILLPR